MNKSIDLITEIQINNVIDFCTVFLQELELKQAEISCCTDPNSECKHKTKGISTKARTENRLKVTTVSFNLT